MARRSTDKPSISVVIPAYKQQDFVTRCLDSVLAQTYEGPVEIVVVDDGSPDDVAEVAASHECEPTVIRQDNTGVAGARNRGIEESNGDYVAFLDADDWWVDNKLDRQMQALAQRDEPALAFSRYRRIRDDGDSTSEPEHPSLTLKPTARKLAFGNFIGNSTVVAHRACLERVGGYPETEILGRGGQDYALWLRVAALFPLLYVPEVLTLYRVHASNRVGTDPLKHFDSGLNALDDFYQWAPDRFREVVGSSYRVVVAARTLTFLKDAVIRRHAYPDGTFRRSLKTAAAHLFQ
jgi:glycosyltransferase involved in cell wall biosynthesis